MRAAETISLLAGLVVGLGSYGMLTIIAVVLVVPLIAMAVRAGYQQMEPATR